MALTRVLLAHNPAGPADDPSTSDVLAQVALVEEALAELGIPSSRTAAEGGRLLDVLREAARTPGTAVFNLIEAPPGVPHVHPDSAALFELCGLPFTGSPAAALWLTTDKLATRALLAAEGLAVPPGGRLDPGPPAPEGVLDRVPPPWILKPALEDASLGLDGDPVCGTREAALRRAADLARRFPGQPVLAESFLPGRELNVSLLEGDAGVEVLPVAEILFQGFPEGMPRLVGYEAKWDEGSFAYRHTVRHFPAEDSVLPRVREMALAAWRLCGLRGYARVDFRLDGEGVPHILEVNANPCLAPDAGFLAAAERAGLPTREVVRRILRAAQAEAPSLTPSIRRRLEAADREPLAELIRETGFFSPEEIEVALELIDDRIAQGEESHYRFLVAQADGEVAGYACWGPIPGTAASVDLYWIVVHPRCQGWGVGAALLRDAEAWVGAAGRSRVYVETSTRAQYEGTRRFYLGCGYELAAELPDFYKPGDGKAVFLKVLA